MATVCLPHRVKFETRASKKTKQLKIVLQFKLPMSVQRQKERSSLSVARQLTPAADIKSRSQVRRNAPALLLFLTSPRASLTLS